MADDPLAPIQAGDDVRKILSASRQNALADAARIVRGSLPVRWGRNKTHRKHAGQHLWAYAILTETLVPNGSAEAQLMKPGESDAHPPVLSDETVTVWDFGLNANVLLSAGTKVQIAKADLYDRYYVVNAYST